MEDRRGLSHLCAARSVNGVDGWNIDPTPTLMPDPDEYPEELWGIEDPRITYVPELQQYAVAYTSYSKGGPGVSLALTRDFRTFERYGVIMSPDDKDAALLPLQDRRTVGTHPSTDDSSGSSHLDFLLSRSASLGRPSSDDGGAQRAHGGTQTRLACLRRPSRPREVGSMLYHGVKQTASGSLYRIGLALFDIQKPDICLLRGDSWIFGPETDYERGGDVHDVVFPCGHTISPDGDTINIYYGAGDSCIALAHASVRSLLSWLDTNGKINDAERNR